MKKVIIAIVLFISVIYFLPSDKKENVQLTLLVGDKEMVLNKKIYPKTLRVVQEGNTYTVESWVRNDYETIAFFNKPTRIIKIVKL